MEKDYSEFDNTYRVVFVDESELAGLPANTLRLVANGLDIDSITRVDSLPDNPSEEKIYEVNGKIYYYDNSEWHRLVLKSELDEEALARANADSSLQQEIDALEVAADVKDVVGTKSELDNYDTSSLSNNDIIKVLTDETHSGETSYYRYQASSDTFSYVGSVSPYYTKTETDSLLAEKQDEITSENMLASDLVDDTTSNHKFATQSQLNKLDNLQPIYNIGIGLNLSNNTLIANVYTNGFGLDLNNSQFSVNTNSIQEKLSEGSYINISNNQVSCTIDALSASDWEDIFDTANGEGL